MKSSRTLVLLHHAINQMHEVHNAKHRAQSIGKNQWNFTVSSEQNSSSLVNVSKNPIDLELVQSEKNNLMAILTAIIKEQGYKIEEIDQETMSFTLSE